VLGESVRGATYYHVERTFRIRREEIPRRLEEFHEALQGMLGEGVTVVEKLIAKDLYAKLGLHFEQHGRATLIDYVNRAKEVNRNEKR